MVFFAGWHVQTEGTSNSRRLYSEVLIAIVFWNRCAHNVAQEENKTAHSPLVARERRAYRVSIEGLKLIAALAKKLGVGQTHVIELSVRDLAQKHGVSVGAK